MIEENTEFIAQEKVVATKDMEVFYNPVMKYNRDLTIAVLKAYDRNNLRIALPLAGSGIRGMRIINELNEKVSYVICNDQSPTAFNILKKNKEILNLEKFLISQQEASIFLLSNKAFDYIDIDPFGSPNSFLDASIKRISIGGILAVTATDTSALAGTYPKACKRKYWAVPQRGNHEIGLRILIRKAQLIGMQYEKLLMPIISISKDHYYKVFFEVLKGKSLVDKIDYETKDGYGPMYTGPLFNELGIEAIKNLEKNTFNKILLEEASSQLTGKNYYDLHKICKKYKLKTLVKQEVLIKKISHISKSHISSSGIWTDLSEDELLKFIR